MSERLSTEGNGKDQSEFMIVSRTDNGYRVYPASRPGKQHYVSGNLNDPACTCDAFAEDGGCEHTRAVQEQALQDQREAREERLAIQAEGQPTPKRKRKATTHVNPATMTLKRSVSPDGRIDSLSVEISCPVDQASIGDIKNRAANMLTLQTEIADGFLKGNGNGHSEPPKSVSGNGNRPPRNAGNGAVAAKMVSIGATHNGKFFISFQVNGQGAKYFGTAKQLAQAVRAGGYAYNEADVAEGIYLNLPCRVITRETSDGRYINVERVLPSNRSAPQKRSAS